MKLIIKFILWKFSIIYRIVIFFWDLYWRNANQVKLPCKIISIGNITAGGTGKTPLAIYLARLASKSGLKTAVIARGYKRERKGLTELHENSTWLEVGDEPLEIFRVTENVRVYVCRSKTRAAQKAFSDGAELIIIDDGFQHRRLARDVNIVCLDCSRPLGPGGYLPLGLLREPPQALKRADIIVYTSYINNSHCEKRIENIAGSKKAFFSSSSISAFVDLHSRKEASTDEISAKKIIAFCGLGSPEKFKNSLDDIKIVPEEFIAFDDHYRYTQDDIERLKNTALEHKANIFITTFKDAVKIEGFDFGDFDIYSAMMEIRIIDQSGADRSDEFRAEVGL